MKYIILRNNISFPIAWLNGQEFWDEGISKNIYIERPYSFFSLINTGTSHMQHVPDLQVFLSQIFAGCLDTASEGAQRLRVEASSRLRLVNMDVR